MTHYSLNAHIESLRPMDRETQEDLAQAVALVMGAYGILQVFHVAIAEEQDPPLNGHTLKEAE